MKVIAQSKGNHPMKFCQLIEHKKRNIFFKNNAKIEAATLVPDLFLFSKRTLPEVKANGLQLTFSISR